MKHTGQGNVPDGIKTTAVEELALWCPACLQPGINLPADWDSAPPEYQFLYLLILALNTNFHLKNLYQSSWEKDPRLHTGLAHFVEPTKYLEHVSQYATQKDISLCSGFKTLSHAATKSTIRLWVMGVGMLVYMCHEVIQPLAIVDLQWGECRIELQYGVPKCHCKGHKLCCQCSFSMNIHIVGHMDGKGIECCLVEINRTANSTKEMGSGNHYDTLDIQFVWHNWKKVIGLGSSASYFSSLTCEIPAQVRLACGSIPGSVRDSARQQPEAQLDHGD
ncbi:hypothetical protein EDD18DRAFT_1312003 [Armillaria luteobubalina]|uniref:CxC2-like cysteine cluster KDZ transposase-associated domain-containing protein n=1 Tax=Armillaria luteobubalina TaxID=153913 RepID=A0AA39TE26_9AGAR|nr:hypothetical protein EDD18DRAFT_1312003 [Armillaria luteobubalina]